MPGRFLIRAVLINQLSFSKKQLHFPSVANLNVPVLIVVIAVSPPNIALRKTINPFINGIAQYVIIKRRQLPASIDEKLVRAALFIFDSNK